MERVFYGCVRLMIRVTRTRIGYDSVRFQETRTRCGKDGKYPLPDSNRCCRTENPES